MFLKLNSFLVSELESLLSDSKFQLELQKIIEDDIAFITSLEQVGSTSNYVVIDFEYLLNALNTETLSQLIKNAIQDDTNSGLVMKTDLDATNLVSALDKLDNIKVKIGHFVFLKVFKIKKSQRLTKELLVKKIDKVIKASRSEIAAEFGIDIKTLNVWIKEIYGIDKFKGKEIRFSEYLDLFNKILIDKESNSFSFNQNKEHFKKIFDKSNHEVKKVYSKKDIIDLSSSDYKIAKNQLVNHNEIEFYKNMNLFPYSLAKQLLGKMNGKE